MISILLPVFNGERYLKTCLKSIENQTFTNFEVIVVDDGSSDGSLKIIEQYCTKDARFRVIKHPSNSGLPAALNTASRIAKGEFHTWISHDNFIGPEFLNEMYQVFQRESTDILYSDYFHIIEESNQTYEVKVENVKYIACGNIFGASFLYRSEVFDILHGYNKDLVMFEDYDFFVRAYLKGLVFQKTDLKPYYYRIHKSQLTFTREMPRIYYEYRYNLIKELQSDDKYIRARSVISLLKIYVLKREIKLFFKLIKIIRMSDVLPIFKYAKSKLVC